MKGRKNITLIIVAVLLVGLVLFGITTYNKMVREDEAVERTWADVENQYQRRLDLIPNLVEVVKGYAQHERATLEGVIEARAKASQVTIDPTNLTADKLSNFQAAQDNLTQSLGKLMVVVERYPDLKANENFRELQAQLEGTENRIAVARRDFNAAVQSYNVLVRRFPQNLIAGIAGFEKKARFEAIEGAEKAPSLEGKFDF